MTPQRKWRAIAVATVLFVPATWSVALGLALLPFAFVALAFLSEHEDAPRAAVRAMALSVVVGLVVSFVAMDLATGVVAGVGAGGIVALRAGPGHTWQARAIAVAVAATYTFVLSNGMGVVLLAPVLPLTGIGVADHLSERRLQQSRS
jgi:hypothetical protein